jgi:hypothetical protein
VKGEDYKPAIRFVVAAARKAGLDEEALELWWDGMSRETIKARLHGWRLLEHFCRERGLTAQGIMEMLNPTVLMANFIAFVDRSKVPSKWRTDSRPATSVVFGLLLPGAKLADNAFLRSSSRSAIVTVKRQSRYGDIWSMGPVLDGIRNAKPIEMLDWKEKKERAAFLLMAFVSLRMIAVWRLDPTTQKPSKMEGAIEVETRDKTDTKRSRSVALIRPLPDKCLCPLNAFRILERGARRLGVTDSLFCSDRGVKYTTNDTIRRGVANLTHRLGVSKKFKGNLVRHATINAAISIVKTTHGVNAYTGHSNKATAVLDFYYHQNENWAGLKLSQLSGAGPMIVPVPEDA